MEIRAENLVKRYGDSTALDGVSLTIQDGELFFLLGPSGCGKTTLLRIIGGFETPTSGEILLGGKPAGATPPDQRDTAMVFQGYALWPHLTVRENVSFGLEMRKIPRDERERRVNQVMDELQIRELADRKPNQISGGQQQRVALARTLVVHPGGLLLDEPLANLDAKLRRETRREIRRVCKENRLTGVYVTHDRSEALSMADRIAVMRGGKIEQTGTPWEIYRRPRTPFVAGFIGETNLRDATLLRREGADALLETPLGILRSRACPGEFSPGDPVALSLRPETLRVLSAGEAAPPGANVLPGVLRSREYLGEMAQCEVEDSAGGILCVDQLNPPGAFGEGGGASLAIAPEDVVCMRP